MPTITIYIPKDVSKFIGLNPTFNRSAAFTKLVRRLIKKSEVKSCEQSR
jgi:hypothetical protein